MDIIAVGRRDFDKQGFMQYIDQETTEFIKKKPDFSSFLSTIQYSKVELNKSDDYANLKTDIEKLQRADSQVIFYLSISPEHFSGFVDNYKHIAPGNAKVIFEKPFWTDMRTARALNAKIMEVFREEQVYRIDHYVWKEAVQNILAFRFTNTIFEAIWNNKYIDNIQITASESIGVLDRWGYYDTSGALRDMVQNHLLQVLSLVVMDAPSGLDARGIQQEKLKVFRNITLSESIDEHVIFWQYHGYLGEKDIAPSSRTETFVAMRMCVDSWNFFGVPIYLRTGKAMAKKHTQIVVEFKDIPNILFKKTGPIEKNRIILEIQPNEWIDIHFNIKQNGSSKEVERVKSEFVKEVESKEAYEKLLEDVIVWDKMLFTSWDMLEETWRIIDDLVNCKTNCPMVYPYEKWTNGPSGSYELLERDNRKWYE